VSRLVGLLYLKHCGLRIQQLKGVVVQQLRSREARFPPLAVHLNVAPGTVASSRRVIRRHRQYTDGTTRLHGGCC
jgi:hypothetical protein